MLTVPIPCTGTDIDSGSSSSALHSSPSSVSAPRPADCSWCSNRLSETLPMDADATTNFASYSRDSKGAGSDLCTQYTWQGDRARRKRDTKGVVLREKLQTPRVQDFLAVELCCREGDLVWSFIALSLTWATSSKRSFIHPIVARLFSTPSLIFIRVFGCSSLTREGQSEAHGFSTLQRHENCACRHLLNVFQNVKIPPKLNSYCSIFVTPYPHSSEVHNSGASSDQQLAYQQ